MSNTTPFGSLNFDSASTPGNGGNVMKNFPPADSTFVGEKISRTTE